MEILWWSLIGAMGAAVLLLAGKIYLMRRAARELEEGLREKLRADTNTLIDISTRDRDMRRLASRINGELGPSACATSRETWS